MLVGFGCQCKWIRGFGLAMLVVSWLWVASASGFWLCFLGLSCCANGCRSIFNEFCGRLLMTVVVVVVLFSVFCFAMDYVCHSGGGGGGGNGSSVVVVIYCIRYIILLYCLYYFNVL